MSLFHDAWDLSKENVEAWGWLEGSGLRERNSCRLPSSLVWDLGCWDKWQDYLASSQHCGFLGVRRKSSYTEAHVFTLQCSGEQGPIIFYVWPWRLNSVPTAYCLLLEVVWRPPMVKERRRLDSSWWQSHITEEPMGCEIFLQQLLKIQ